MSFDKLLCFAYFVLKSVTSSKVAIHHVHELSLNLNFENPLRIIENYTRGSQKIFGQEYGGADQFENE